MSSILNTLLQLHRRQQSSSLVRVLPKLIYTIRAMARVQVQVHVQVQAKVRVSVRARVRAWVSVMYTMPL